MEVETEARHCSRSTHSVAAPIAPAAHRSIRQRILPRPPCPASLSEAIAPIFRKARGKLENTAFYTTNCGL